jgi:hypothetical protein
MNMISTGAFLNGMDASDKQDTLTAKLVKAWEKKNAKLARTGGVSLMALSLAACGSDDTTTTTTTTDTTTTDTTTTTTTPTAKTMTLTSGVDAGADYTGGGADDTFIGDNTPTLDQTSTADQLDGGAGTDTLKIYSDGAAPGLPVLTSVETVTIYDQDANLTLDAIDQASVTTVNLVRSDGALTLTVPVGVTTAGLTNIGISGAGGDAGITVAAAATATTMTLNLDRLSTAGNDADEDVNVSGAKIATVTINSSGTKSAVDNMDLAGAATINIDAKAQLTIGALTTSSTTGAMTITGDSKVSLGIIDDGIDTVTATSATGNITFTAPDDNTAFIANLGSGDDNITTRDDGFAAANTFNIDAGAGTDILTVAAAADLDTAAEAARYDNFETISTANSQDMSLVAGITGLIQSSGNAKSFTKMTAAQLENVTFTGNNGTSSTFTLANATGTADTAKFTLASATATTNVDVIGISVVGVEHVDIAATTGTNTSGDTDFGFLANASDSVKTIDITGTADVELNVVANTLDVVAVAIDASGMTGTADLVITRGVLVDGSSVTGTANGDTIAVSSTTGVTYDSGAGNDAFTGSLADLVQTGSSDTKIDGGAGTDSLTIDDTTTTLTDNHFMGLSNLETFAMSNTTGNLSLTTGAGFNSAFANGVTMTTGTIAASKDVNLAAGLASVDITFTATMTSSVGKAVEDNNITTGSGNDTITFTGDATYVGIAGGAGGTIDIVSGAGNDTIKYTVGTLVQDTTHAITVTGGTGVDTITATKVNANDAQGIAKYVFAAGDSLVTAHDTITGFDTSTGSIFADQLEFAGTAAIGTVGTQNDFGTITSSSTTAGVAQFDDAAGFTTALVISSTNLADVVGYLQANTATNDVVAFAYDNNADGTNDGTMVYHNGTTDSLVLLASLTGVDALITTNASAGTGDIFIS